MKHIIILIISALSVFAQNRQDNFTVKTNLQTAFINGVPSKNIITGELINIPASQNYWALGDSQTIGQFVANYNFTDGTGSMYPEFRYANIIASKYGLNLTNRAVSGSRIAYTAAVPDSTLAQANVIPASWSGLVTVMHGYNDSGGDNYETSTRTVTLFRNAANAVIGRLLASDWINPQGTNSSGVAASGFSTSGTVSDGGNAGLAPFPIGAPSTGTRKMLTLTGSQTVTFSATNPIVWFQTGPVGGTAALWQGTNQIAAVNTDTDDASTYALPQAIFGRELSGTFTVTNISGSNIVLAVGALLESANATNRTVLVASPIRLKSSIRIDGVAALIGSAIRSAIQDWTDFQVGYADTATKIDLATMLPSGDPNHPNPYGHKVMAKAFENAVRPDAIENSGSPSPRYSDQGFQVFGSTEATQIENKQSVLMSVASGIGYVQSYNPLTPQFYPLELQSSSTRVSQSGLAVMGGFSSVSQYPVGGFAELQYTAPNVFLSSLSSDGSSVSYNPIRIRAKNTAIINGNFSVGSEVSSVSDYYVGDSLTFQASSTTASLDSINSDGSTITYKPLRVRARRTTIENGPFAVASGISTTSDYYVGNSLTLQTSGSVSSIGAVNSDGSTLAYNPLTVSAKKTSVINGPFAVAGSASTVSDYHVGNSVSLQQSGGQGYVDGINSDGSSVTFIPINVRAKRFQIDNGFLSVSSSPGSIADYKTGNQLALYGGGGSSYIQSITNNGSSYTTLPLIVEASNVELPYGAMSVGAGGNPGIAIRAAQNGIPFVDFNTLTTNRWRVAKNNTTESGSNVGADFVIERYSDAGALLDTPFQIIRSTGRVGIGASGTPVRIRAGTAVIGAGGTVTVSDGFVTANSNIQLTGQADGGTPGWLRVTARTPGVSFTITSSSATDTSTVGWVMFEP